MAVEFMLNGKQVSSQSDPRMRLLDVLREEFAMTGVKEGCGEGECGACAVLLNEKIVNSCIVPLGSIEGQEVKTIEGVRETDRGRTIEAAFADEGAVQCGMCTPGMVIATHSLLHANPNPSEHEIRDGLSGNLCRCTGYNSIVKAVQKVAEKEGE